MGDICSKVKPVKFNKNNNLDTVVLDPLKILAFDLWIALDNTHFLVSMEPLVELIFSGGHKPCQRFSFFHEGYSTGYLLESKAGKLQ